MTIHLRWLALAHTEGFPAAPHAGVCGVQRRLTSKRGPGDLSKHAFQRTRCQLRVPRGAKGHVIQPRARRREGREGDPGKECKCGILVI